MMDKNRLIEIEKIPNKSKSILLALGAFIFFIFTSSLFASIAKILFTNINVSLLSPNSVLDVFSQTNLGLSGNNVLQWVSLFGFIAVVETFAFVMLYEVLMDAFNVTQLKFKFKAALIILIISSIFTIFHITAKGIANTESLMLVFYFMVISLALVLIEGQALAAIFFHMIANGVASLPLLGITLNVTTIILYAGAIGGLLYFITKGLNIKQLLSRIGG